MDKLSEDDLKSLLKEKKKTKGKIKFSKKIVSLVIVMNILFTLAILFVFFRTGSEPTALVGAWFTFTTVELWNLSKIKRTEVKKDE